MEDIKVRLSILIPFFAVLIIIFYGFLGTSVYGVFSERDRLSAATDIDSIGERLTPLFYQINAFPGRVSQEVLFLSKILSFGDNIDDFRSTAYKKSVHARKWKRTYRRA